MAMDQPWTFLSTFSDPWISDILAMETQTLTRVLQKPSSNDEVFSNELIESLFVQPEITPIQTPTISGVSENEISVSNSKQPSRSSLPPSGRVTKRKSRVSKRAKTTFINTDPENFRQMVQQVTGARFGGLNEQLPVFKPEPKRVVNRLQIGVNGLQTVDSSSFFMDGSGSGLLDRSTPSYTVVEDHGGAASAGFGFDSFCNFPTLESWKV